jgi:hypothetical protein
VSRVISSIEKIAPLEPRTAPQSHAPSARVSGKGSAEVRRGETANLPNGLEFAESLMQK